jgi:hypothetical protein
MGKSIDLVGKDFGHLTVLRKTSERNASGCVMWECLCVCGNKKLYSTNDLNKGSAKSCGCMQTQFEDLTGKRFGRLVVLASEGYHEKSHSVQWKCRCDCGKEKIVLGGNLKTGKTVSCGCYSSEQKSLRSWKHGIGNENRLFRIWAGIKQRCYNPNVRNYKRYGARGITMCDEWLDSFLTFQKWALENGYSDNLSIDRIDNNGNYCPENCRWTSTKKQNNNRGTTVFITYKGETHSVAEWSEITGIHASTLAQRKRNGWSDVECLEVPVDVKNNQTTRKPFPDNG